MRRGEVDARRELGPVAVYGAHGYGNGRHAGEVGGDGEDVLEIHGDGVRFLAELERWRRRRGESDDIARRERVVVFISEHLPGGFGLLVVGIYVAARKYERTKK